MSTKKKKKKLQQLNIKTNTIKKTVIYNSPKMMFQTKSTTKRDNKNLPMVSRPVVPSPSNVLLPEARLVPEGRDVEVRRGDGVPHGQPRVVPQGVGVGRQLGAFLRQRHFFLSVQTTVRKKRWENNNQKWIC